MKRNDYEIRGFTLIELLVVIAIIGILSSVVLASLNGARTKANDVNRLSTANQITKALELYYDTNSHYPIVGTWASFDSPAYSPTAITSPNAANLTAAMAPYLSAPRDPKASGDRGYLYLSDGTGSQYCLLLYGTPDNMNNFPSSMWAMNRCTSVGANGVCTGINSVWKGTGAYATSPC